MTGLTHVHPPAAHQLPTQRHPGLFTAQGPPPRRIPHRRAATDRWTSSCFLWGCMSCTTLFLTSPDRHSPPHLASQWSTSRQRPHAHGHRGCATGKGARHHLAARWFVTPTNPSHCVQQRLVKVGGVSTPATPKKQVYQGNTHPMGASYAHGLPKRPRTGSTTAPGSDTLGCCHEGGMRPSFRPRQESEQYRQQGHQHAKIGACAPGAHCATPSPSSSGLLPPECMGQPSILPL